MNWSYIAGFTDGEGCIKIYSGQPRLTLGQNTSEVLEAIKSFLGLRNKITHSNGCFYLQVNKVQELVVILEAILPELIVKRQDALTALECCYNLLAASALRHKYCPQGHDKDTTGRTVRGGCIICSRETQARSAKRRYWQAKHS